MRSLDDALGAWRARGPTQEAVAAVLVGLAAAAAKVAGAVAAVRPDAPAEQLPGAEADALEALAEAAFRDALAATPAAGLSSGERPGVQALPGSGGLVVALDPLEGASNITINATPGSIFSVLPAAVGNLEAALVQPGRSQLAAGFVVYGPRTMMVVSWGEGATLFALDPQSGTFREAAARLTIPAGTRELAINSSAYRLWDEHFRAFVDDCMAGADGPLAADYAMRWGASLVPESFRLFRRGGVFACPGDARSSYQKARLRLVHQANAIAFVAEQAGGAATTGLSRVLDIVPRDISQRTPLIVGSADHVERIGRYYQDLNPASSRAPLFGSRGLLRI